MTHLELAEALKRAKGGHAQPWQYLPTLARFVVRVYFDSTWAAGIYFVCAGCRRIEISPHWYPASLSIVTSEMEDAPLALVDATDCRIECETIAAVESDDFLEL